ncbi:uncharacterized protein [Antedon mediterranea]|uniref:uncharacterized protein n=1 Tax=Antedon mediterranea TaxID=105859 RepID=UPI003AF7CE4B
MMKSSCIPGFTPQLSPLQEEEELNVLSDILYSHGRRLLEDELWAVCKESVVSLKSIEGTKGRFRTIYLCPETIAFSKDGAITYKPANCEDSEYLPPEYEICGASFEGHLYSLALCLLEAAEFNLPAEQQVEISNGLLGLVTLMTLDDPSRRPCYEEIITTCVTHLEDKSSQEICRKLSSIGKSVKSQEINSQHRRSTIGEDGNDQSVSQVEKYLHQIKLNENLGEHSKKVAIQDDFEELIEDTMTSKEDGKKSGAYDTLSQRAQEILKEIYSGTETPQDSVSCLKSEETSPIEGQTATKETLPKQVLSIANILQNRALLRESNTFRKYSSSNDISTQFVHNSDRKNIECLEKSWNEKDYLDSPTKITKTNEQLCEQSGRKLQPSTTQHNWKKSLHLHTTRNETNLCDGEESIPENEEKVKHSICSKEHGEEFVVHDPSSSSDLPNPVSFKRTTYSHSMFHKHSSLNKERDAFNAGPRVSGRLKTNSIHSSMMSEECIEDKGRATLPQAYSSKATHFTPIVISSDKSKTEVKQNTSPVSVVKLKAKIAMEAIKKGPQIPKKVPPPATMLTDLENDAANEDSNFSENISHSNQDKPIIPTSIDSLLIVEHMEQSFAGTQSNGNKQHEQDLHYESIVPLTSTSFKPVNKIDTGDAFNNSETLKHNHMLSDSTTMENETKSPGEEAASVSMHGFRQNTASNLLRPSFASLTFPVATSVQSLIPAIPVSNLVHAVPFNLPSTQRMASTVQKTPVNNVLLRPTVPSLGGLSSKTQPASKEIIHQLPNISGPMQICQDPHTGFFHIIPVEIPGTGTVPILQSSFAPDVEAVSPNTLNCSLSPISTKEIPTTFSAKTDLTGLHSSAFRPIEPHSNKTNTIATNSSSFIAHKSSKHAKDYLQTGKTKSTGTNKDISKKEYRKKLDKKVLVVSKLPYRKVNHETDSESSESTYHDPNVRMPRYMKRTVKSNHGFQESEKCRSKSQGRTLRKERERSKSRERAKSLDRKSHEKLVGPETKVVVKPVHKLSQDKLEKRTKMEDVDDTKPIDASNSPTSVSIVSRDSGVHMRYSHSSGEDATGLTVYNPLKDALAGNNMLRKVVKLVRVAFAFDGYLENGVEDLQMGEYIVSLAHLRWMTFVSAITEKFCDLYWEEDLLESLYEVVNGSLPRKSQKPLAMSPSRPRRKTEPIILSPSNTPDNLDSDDNASIIDDLLPADNTFIKKGTKNSKILRSNVVAHAELFKRQQKPKSKKSNDKTTKVKGVDPKDLTDKLSELEKNTKDRLDDAPVVTSRQKKRHKNHKHNDKNVQEPMEPIPEKSKESTTESKSLDFRQHDLSKSMSSIASGSSFGSSSKSLQDSRDRSKSGSYVASEGSVKSASTENCGKEHILQTHRKPKMLATSLPNPTTLVRHSSESSSSSGTATKYKLKSIMFNHRLTKADSSLSLISGASLTNTKGLVDSKTDSILSLPSSVSTGDNSQLLLNAGVMYGDLAVDPIVEDYTNKLVVNCETQQGIEVKIGVIDQELMMERKMRSKSQKFYHKMLEAQQTKGTDYKTMVIRVGKEIDEMTNKIEFLESAKRHLEMLYSEQWGLDHSLLYTFATSMGQEPMYLHHSQEECPLLLFHYIKSGSTLQAGEPLGLFSYLYARQALLDGYIHYFFSTYHYYATTDEIFKFIVDKFCAARSMSSAQAESRTKILCRTIDILQVWIENYYAVDFRPNLNLVNQLTDFITEKIISVDAQGECLLKLLKKCQQEKEKDMLLETLRRHQECGNHAKPKKRYSIREVLSVPSRALRAEKMPSGVASCFSAAHKKESMETQSIYIPVQSGDKEFTMSEHTAQRLAYQLTLMQQELFRKVHPVHYLNSRYNGIGVGMEVDVSLSSPSISRAEVEQDYPNLFVNTLGDEGLVHIQLEHAREVSHWVAAEVVTSVSQKYQTAILCKFIMIARECYDMRNLATCMQIIDALESLIVRQVPAWRNLPSKIGSSFEKLKAAKIILKGDGESLIKNNIHHDKPTLPCSLFLLMHLQSAEIGGFTLANGMYKWTKMKSIAKLVDQIRVFQNHTFTFESDAELQELLQKRILQMNDHDIHSLAAQHSANFHQLASEKSSNRFKVAFKKVKHYTETF